MKNTYKICFIGYGRLTELAKTVISRPEFSEGSILLVDSTVDGLHRTIDNAVQQGCEVFIAGSANAAEFRRYSGATLIELKLRPIDFAIAIRKALTLGKRPVVVSYCFAKVIRPEEIAILFDTPIEYVEYQSSEELLEKLQNSDADAVVGASHVNEVAAQLGKSGVFVYPGEEMIVDALRRARTVVTALQKEQRNNKLIHAIISESKTGIIGFSEQREVLIINAAARRFTGLGIEQARRSRLRQFISDEEFRELLEKDKKSKFLVKQQGEQLLKMQLLKLENNGRSIGALLLLEGIKDTEGAEDSASIIPFPSLPTFHDMVSLSPAMKKAVAEAKLYGGRSGVPLMIMGEYGAGKELMAQSIHSFYRADRGDYVSINCAAVLDGEAAHFFYSSGGDGASADKGVLDLSSTGTLLLENLWEASEKLQACILWAVQGRQSCVFMGSKGKSLRAEVITLVPTEKWSLCVRNVRADLLQSLQALTLTIPPLRERVEDIAALFFRDLNGTDDYDPTARSREKTLLPILEGYSWRGNGNELHNVCRRYALGLATGDKLTQIGRKRLLIDCVGEQTLFEDVRGRFGGTGDADSMSGAELTLLCENLKEILLYNNDQIAERLGISRTGMWRKMRQTQP